MKSAHGSDPVSARKGTKNGTKLSMAKKEELNSRVGVGGGGKTDEAFFGSIKLCVMYPLAFRELKNPFKEGSSGISQGRLVWKKK